MLELSNGAFNKNVLVNGASNANWSRELDQKAEHTWYWEGFPDILAAMMYYKIDDIQNVEVILGKGNRTAKPLPSYVDQDLETMIAALFPKVYLGNTLLVDQSFVMFVVKETNAIDGKGNPNKHNGRLTLKFNNSIKYNGIPYNQNCIDAISNAFGVGVSGSWVIKGMSIENRTELHLHGFKIDITPKGYITTSQRDTDFDRRMSATKRQTPNYPQNNHVAINKIIYGAPGTGKSYDLMDNEVKGNPYVRVTFHPDTDYSSFVGSYKPVTEDDDSVTYRFVAKQFLDIYQKAWNDPEHHYYLLIEEINRGDCARIFGDMFQLLDRDVEKHPGYSSYMIHVDNDIERYLKEHIEEQSYVTKLQQIYGQDATIGCMALPNNLSIIATMNTSDQSLYQMDSAFKRRWQWEYKPIQYDKIVDWILEVGQEKYSWRHVLPAINKLIANMQKSAAKQLGEWFIRPDKTDGKTISYINFRDKVLFYLFTDAFKDDDDFTHLFVDEADGDDSDETFLFEDLYNDSTGAHANRFIKKLDIINNPDN